MQHQGLKSSVKPNLPGRFVNERVAWGAGRNISRMYHQKQLAERSTDETFVKETAGLDECFYSGSTVVSDCSFESLSELSVLCSV